VSLVLPPPLLPPAALLAILQAFVIDGFDDVLVIEVDDIHLLVNHIGVKE